jgi:hypothetical protein
MKAVVVVATVLVVTVVHNNTETAMLTNAVDGTASETECSCPKATVLCQLLYKELCTFLSVSCKVNHHSPLKS